MALPTYSRPVDSWPLADLNAARVVKTPGLLGPFDQTTIQVG